MEAQRTNFLTSMIGILDRLQETCVSRGEPLLASVLAIAKGEAEDARRHAEELASLHAMREKMSSQTSWRAADQERTQMFADKLRRDVRDDDARDDEARDDDHEVEARHDDYDDDRDRLARAIAAAMERAEADEIAA